MQPTGNRPVYIIQQNPSVRPVTSFQQPRFVTSPQQIFATNVSPQLITSQNITRLPTVTITRPTFQSVVSPQTTVPSPPAAPAAAPGSKEYAVRVPRTGVQYGIMEFASGIAIDLKDGNSIEMRREINPFTYRPASNTDGNAASSSNTITTSLGAVVPKTGAGSEYGREQKEALKRKRYATKGTNMEDLPWLLTNRLASEKKLKHFRGMKKGGIALNSSYYVFIQGKDGFEAYPVNDWYGFTPTNVFKTLDYDEAEQKYLDRNKTLSKWFKTHQVIKEKDPDEEGDDEEGKGKKTTSKRKNDFKLLDTEEWDQGHDEDEEDDEENDLDDEKGNKNSKKKKTGKKPKKGTGTNLSDDDEDEEADRANAKKKKSTAKENNEQGEDSENGDHDQDEIDYTSDETSEEEEDTRDQNTVKSSAKYEAKGIDEEMKFKPDIDKKLEQMDDNDGGIDFDDDDDESIPEIEDNEEDSGKGNAGDELSDVSKLWKNDAISKEIESSSDEDDSDDSDDPDKETIEPTVSSSNTQPIPSEQIKTEKGHKKAREEEMRAIKSKVMSLPPPSAASSNPTDTITDEKVRTLLLQRHHMTFSELIQKFLPKTENLRTQEVKDGIVQKLAAILKRLNIEEKTINGKKHIKLK